MTHPPARLGGHHATDAQAALRRGHDRAVATVGRRR
jgi:hypothetical protein